MSNPIICKFGGSSLADVDAIQHARTALKTVGDRSVIVVVSAIKGVTDDLLRGYREAKQGNAKVGSEVVAAFSRRHQEIVEKLITVDQEKQRLLEVVEQSAQTITKIFESLTVVRDSTERIEAQLLAFGERSSAQIFASFVGYPFKDAADLIRISESVDSDAVTVDHAATSELCKKWFAECDGRGVVPGFIAAAKTGELRTLGRGGTDYSAAILASALAAERLVLFKEVDGVMTADPSIVKNARIVPRLGYREAAELAFYGAKILHPKTMIPLARAEIPLNIRNTFDPKQPGTEITTRTSTQGFPVKALSAMRKQVLVTIEGRGMQGVPGVAARTFSVLANLGVSVSVITQSSSEASICFVIPEDSQYAVIEKLKEEFRWDLQAETIDRIEALQNLCTIAVVGSGMSGEPGIAGRVFASLGRAEVNVIAIAQGATELNITLVVNEAQVDSALRALHLEFQLHKSQALETGGLGETAVSIYGFGQIGRELLRQINGNQDYLKDSLKGEIKFNCLIDRSGMLMRRQGFSSEAMSMILAAKEKGRSLALVSRENPVPEFYSDYKSLWELPSNQSIFVDTSASDSYPLLLEAIRHDFHVVLANKKPLTVSYDEYRQLFNEAQERNLSVRFEATVGAGLPILDTLEKIHSTGDEVSGIEGCFSGTLGFIFSGLEKGERFSKIVREAFDAGYTEPDPRDDLDGRDVARKALILARYLGWSFEMEEIDLEPLFPADLSNDDPQEFLQGLERLDTEYEERVAAAQKDGKVLRYVARVARDGLSVGIEAVDLSTSLGGLKGTDNQVVLTSRRYQDQPLVVTGPGAGAGVTAQGVFNDIVAITRGRRKGI